MSKGPAKVQPEAVPATGLTVLFELQNPCLDIVFVHGFTGHPERTWTTKAANARRGNVEPSASSSIESHSKLRKLNPFARPLSDGDVSASTVYWPRKLVPITVPGARVLTYGYDTQIRHWTGPPVNRCTVYDIAWDFLVALESARRTNPSRPVLFVAHSLGGIIVKEVLRQSRGCRAGKAHLHDIFKSTIGIIFFGTPHAGADPRGFLQRVAEKAIKAVGWSYNEQLVNSLLPPSERLRELRDDFGLMIQECNWMIHSFQEQFGIDALERRKVVEDTSSCLNMPNFETIEHIGRNHTEMCRFAGLNDVEYKKVAAALCRFTSTVSKQYLTPGQPSLDKEQKLALLKSLRFGQMEAREMTIKKEFGKTCEWLLRKSEYLDWLDPSKLGENRGLLWIKGKPGAGKSTLMNFTVANARQTMKDTAIISFFFNGRGDDLERSTTGMYRSFLWQLLVRYPTLQEIFNSLGPATRTSESPQWTIESLATLFEQAVRSLGGTTVTCFVDALDECEERQIRHMISVFLRLGELNASTQVRFRVCLASRYYPHITIAKGLSLHLERQEGHAQDIANYVNSELAIGHSKFADQIRSELQEKAAGVFVWVALVVETLNKEYDRGHIFALRQRLRDIPGNLHELFRDILTRDQHNRGELLLCVQWVLFATQPLEPEQLFFAIHSGVEPEVSFEWNPDEIRVDVTRYILNSSKGLAEVTKSENPTVQFIHESVKDFFLKENGLEAIWSDLGSNFEGESHDRLKRCCVNQIVSTTELPQPLTSMCSFLEYATRNVLYHANAAEKGGVNQTSFLQSFQVANWVYLNNLFEQFGGRRYTPKASLPYILATRNLAGLIRAYPLKFSCFRVEHECYGSPILAALATGSSEAVEAFVDVQSAAQSLPLLQDLCEQLKHGGVKIGRVFTFSRIKTMFSFVLEQDNEALLAIFVATGQENGKDKYGRDPLSYAAERGYEIVVQILSTMGVDMDTKDEFGRTPLWWAAERGQTAVVPLLLDNGADIDSPDRKGWTPFLRAALRKHDGIVRLMLSKRASTDSVHNEAVGNLAGLLLNMDSTGASIGDMSLTPLSWAASNGHEAVVQQLLEAGQVPDARGPYGRTPLLLAAESGHEAIVQLLLETGQVDVNTMDEWGWTSLSRAALNGHETVVRLLLDVEQIDVNTKDKWGWTALSQAAACGHEAVVRLLLEAKQVEVNAKDKSGRTPLSWATEKGHEAVERLLIFYGGQTSLALPHPHMST